MRGGCFGWKSTVLWIGLALACTAWAQNDSPPISLHPLNPKYFLFRGKPTFLLTATEHYGSVLNRAFDFHKYLDDAAAHHMTLTRTFLLFREIAGDKNPASPCKPKAQDYIAPWPRTGPGMALDGQAKFDLSQWNPEYFQRLHDFLDLASARGIVVELTLLSNTYGDPVWALNPLRAENNLQGVGKIPWPQYMSLRDPQVLKYQLDHVRKIVQETAGYDNVYYEICNEPGGGVPGRGFPGPVSPAEVDAWEARIADTVREEMTKAGKTHLIFGSQAFSYTPAFHQDLDATFAGNAFDVVNVHPLPDTILGGRRFQLGNFMSRELHIGDLRDFALTAWKQPKANVWDEDNAASMYRDDVGWTIDRKRAWTALLSGCHYDLIDFSLQAGQETGTPQSQEKLRRWFTILSDYFRTVDFVHAAPMPGWIGRTPPHVFAVTSVVEGKDYIAYLADDREFGDPKAGQKIGGMVEMKLPPGKYSIRFFSPTTGQYTDCCPVEGGQTQYQGIGEMEHDVVLRATLMK
jgi:hypothetical protein